MCEQLSLANNSGFNQLESSFTRQVNLTIFQLQDFAQTTPKGPCTAGWFCEGKANTSTPTSIPEYPKNGPCPTGHYCLQGTQAPAGCPPGTFRNSTGARSEDECLDCTPGFYCKGYSNSFVTGPCAAGYYCPQGSRANVYKPSEYLCPKAHKCPEGTADPIECGAGLQMYIFAGLTCNMWLSYC